MKSVACSWLLKAYIKVTRWWSSHIVLPYPSTRMLLLSSNISTTGHFHMQSSLPKGLFPFLCLVIPITSLCSSSVVTISGEPPRQTIIRVNFQLASFTFYPPFSFIFLLITYHHIFYEFQLFLDITTRM